MDAAGNRRILEPAAVDEQGDVALRLLRCSEGDANVAGNANCGLLIVDCGLPNEKR
jgi:hypothetical protein